MRKRFEPPLHKATQNLIILTGVVSIMAITFSGCVHYKPYGPRLSKESIPDDIPSLVKTKIERLYSEDPITRALSAFQLGSMGSKAAPALPWLTAMFYDASPLAWKRGTVVVKRTSPGSEARSATRLILDKITEPSAIVPIFEALRIEAAYVRRRGSVESPFPEQAKRALQQIGKPAVEHLIAALQDEEPLVQRIAAEVLGTRGGTRSIPPLISLLNNDQEDLDLSLAAARILMTFDDVQVIEAFMESLQNTPFSEIKAIAIRVLQHHRETRAVSLLIDALQDESLSVRGRAASALGILGDTRATDPLIKALQDDVKSVRSSAAFSLGILGDERAIAPLIKALQDDAISVRRGVIAALVEMGHPTVPPLIAALNDQNHQVRSNAARALGKLSDVRSVESLITALNDPDPRIRGNIGRALREMGDIAVPALINALQNQESATIRHVVARELREIGDTRTLQPFIIALKDEDENVRREASVALGRLKDTQAVEPLINALQDDAPSVRRSAAMALGTLGDSRSIDALFLLLKDEDRLVRQSAKSALKRITGVDFESD